MDNTEKLRLLIQAIVGEHNHAHAVMSYTNTKNEFRGAYAAWTSTAKYLEIMGLTYEIRALTEEMQNTIELSEYELDSEYQSLL